MDKYYLIVSEAGGQFLYLTGFHNRVDLWTIYENRAIKYADIDKACKDIRIVHDSHSSNGVIRLLEEHNDK